MASEKLEKQKIWDAVPGFEFVPEIDLPEMHSWFHVAYSIPPWIPLFGIIKGVITDAGGTLCHAAIIGREYGVPTIINTREATAKIKTGQRIRMNAVDGAIFVLDK